MSNKPIKELTEEEINEELIKELSDPTLLHRLYCQDVSKFSPEKLFKHYEMTYKITKLVLFGEA